MAYHVFFFSSNTGHPFEVGLVLSKLSAVTMDDHGKETFVLVESLVESQSE
jgi:hypothetical protein